MQKRLYGIAFAVLFLASVTSAADSPKPLIRAHSHNDYMHARPLLDALEEGFCSVEADINLVDGKLLVAHELKAAKPERTLEVLYLDPLHARVQANGGRVYKDGPECTLLIDIKTDSEATYSVLNATLGKYADMLTEVRDGKVTRRAITVIVDGANELIAAQKNRYAFVDGNVSHLDGNPPVEIIPWISNNWTSVFSWKGVGTMPEQERAKLIEIVKTAHAQGRKVRFWGLPLRPAIWEELYSAGVDLINIDNLKAGREFLLKKGE
jgi:hypothetical protein